MNKDSARWNEVNPSRYPWEREGLAFVRAALPDGEPYRAWANVEFVGDDGTINEIDLLVVTRTGVFLVELKSHPGIIAGDNTRWVWTRPGGSKKTLDNPLPLTRRKCHRIESLLARQPAIRNLKGRAPLVVEPVVFLTDPDLDCQLNPAGRANVFGRGLPPKRPNAPKLPGLVDLLIDNLPPDQQGWRKKRVIDGPFSRAIEEAMVQANIRPSTLDRRIGEYDLHERLGEGEGWEDWEARHRTTAVRRRIRRWLSEEMHTEAEVKRLNRAAEREFDLLKVLRHDGLLLPLDLRQSELGPALVFEFDDTDQPLDHWLLGGAHATLTLHERVRLVRDMAEAMAHAHRKQVFHRALGPQSVHVTTDERGRARLRISDWQTSARTNATRTLEGGTLHVEELVNDDTRAYLAPEALTGDDPDLHRLDVFSLGALAYLVFTGEPPADGAVQLKARLRDRMGLDIADVVDGPLEALRSMVLEATNPNVEQRLPTVEDFLTWLDLANETLNGTERTDGHEPVVNDPLIAEGGDLLPDGWRVERRLGKGSTAVALAVKRNDREEVWKVALDSTSDHRLRDEFEVLQAVKHVGIVTAYIVDEVGPRTVLHLERAGERTLAQYLREEGRCSLDFLQRWGTDLLDVVKVLEDSGIPHRDIKPDNIGIRPRGRGDLQHLLLFDFSLSRTPYENIDAGTPGYRDPFLFERDNKRWDVLAERWGAAVVLYEMATGHRPRWPGGSDPTAVPGMEVVVEREAFDPSVSVAIADFFTKALRRNPRERFDTVEEMQAAWEQVFTSATTSVGGSQAATEEQRVAAVQAATRTSPLAALALSSKALDTLSRRNLHTADDLLNANLGAIYRLPGVGGKVRQEIASMYRLLQEKFPPDAGDNDSSAFSVDRLYSLLLPKDGSPTDMAAMRLLLEPEAPVQLSVSGDGTKLGRWPGAMDVAKAVGISRRDFDHVLERAANRWKRVAAFSGLRNDLVEGVVAHGGVMAVEEMVDLVLAIRGSAAPEHVRRQRGRAVVRAMIEYDHFLSDSRWIPERAAGGLVAADDETANGHGMLLADYAVALGEVADHLVAGDTPPTASTAIERLKQVQPPACCTPLPDQRVVRLAAAASATAATSSRLDLYPRGMSAERAVSLARLALLGPDTLSVEAVQQRVHSRFPEAAQLPGRPELDQLLAPLELRWADDATPPGYRLPQTAAVVSATHSFTRLHTSQRGTDHYNAMVQLAGEFDQRLQRLAAQGGFCALNVRPQRVEALEHRLVQRLGAVLLDVDDVVLTEMRAVAEAKRVNWQLVLATDADRESQNWPRVKELATLAMPAVRERILAAGPTAVLTSAGLLARFGQMSLFDELRDHGDGVRRISNAAARTVLVVVPTDHPDDKPMLGGAPVPVFQPGQWASVPSVWFDDRPLAAMGGQ